MWKVICISALAFASCQALPQNLADAQAELTQVGLEAKGLIDRSVKTAFDLIPSGDTVVEALNQQPAVVPVGVPVPVAGPVPVQYAYYQDANGQVVVVPAGPAQVAPSAPIAPAVNIPEYATISPEGRQTVAIFLRTMADIVADGQFDKAKVKPLLGLLEGLLE